MELKLCVLQQETNNPLFETFNENIGSGLWKKIQGDTGCSTVWVQNLASQLTYQNVRSVTLEL